MYSYFPASLQLPCFHSALSFVSVYSHSFNICIFIASLADVIVFGPLLQGVLLPILFPPLLLGIWLNNDTLDYVNIALSLLTGLKAALASMFKLGYQRGSPGSRI